MTTLATHSTAPPPSRDDNPFATCWTRPGALPYVSTEATTVEATLAAWRHADHQGQIVGPHGVGKSTLLAAVRETLASDGWQVRGVVFRAEEHAAPPRDLFASGNAKNRVVWLIDGLEQLSPWRRWWLVRRARFARVALLATTHQPIAGLPVLARLAPSLPVVLQLFRRLTQNRRTPITEATVADSFKNANGDVRETWFRLYDLHEAARSRIR